MDFTQYFTGKRVTVMGLGLLGRGVGDAAYIAAAGAERVIVTDLKTEETLSDSVAKLKEYSNNFLGQLPRIDTCLGHF